MILNKYFHSLTDELLASYNTSRNLKHSGLKGHCREFFVKNFLSKTFPKKFVIGTGEIIDSNENISKQADVVIYDECMPTFDYGEVNHFLSAGVLAHIEVKSKLDKKELLAALDIIKSIKQLNRDLNPYMRSVQPQPTIPCFLFAYSSIDVEKIFEYIGTYYGDLNRDIDGICILNETTSIIVDGEHKKSIDPKDSLALFFMKLYDSIIKKRSSYPHLGQYLKIRREA